MISITSKTGSSEGVIFEELQTSKLRDMIPRVTKSKTLDGGVVYDHRGMVTADREFIVNARLTQSQFEALQTIVQNETYVNLSSQEGFFEGVISDLSIEDDITKFNYWVYTPIAASVSNTKRMFVWDSLTLTESITVSIS